MPDFRVRRQHGVILLTLLLSQLLPPGALFPKKAEDNKKKSDFIWTVDPLDGTMNFYMVIRFLPFKLLWLIKMKLFYLLFILLLSENFILLKKTKALF